MIGIHTVLWFSWIFWKMRWNYDGFCNGLRVFGPETVEFVDYHEIHLKKSKKSIKKQLVFIGPKVRASQNRLFPCVIRGSENEKKGSEFAYKTLLFWEVPKKSSQNLRNTYNSKKKKKEIGRKRRLRKLPEPEEYLQFRANKFRSKRGSELLATVLTNINHFSKLLIFH